MRPARPWADPVRGCACGRACGSVHAFDESVAVPATAALDISFVRSVLVASDPDHHASRAFVRRIVGHGSVLYFTDLLELQLHDVADRVRPRIGDGASPARPPAMTGGRHRAPVSALPEDLFDRWRSFVAATGASYCELPEVIEGVWDVMTSSGLDATRAATVSLVRETGAHALLTTDVRFASAEPSLTVLVVPPRTVGLFRARRSVDS